ncbi:hypothetical protein [Streptomyces katsurahamanus]|nr:hypothetical protein [Streptomyces katsurahamanus]
MGVSAGVLAAAEYREATADRPTGAADPAAGPPCDDRCEIPR